jgi:hypothetical protein
VALATRCKGEEVSKADYSKKKGDVEVTYPRGGRKAVFFFAKIHGEGQCSGDVAWIIGLGE